MGKSSELPGKTAGYYYYNYYWGGGKNCYIVCAGRGSNHLTSSSEINPVLMGL